MNTEYDKGYHAASAKYLNEIDILKKQNAGLKRTLNFLIETDPYSWFADTVRKCLEENK